MLSSTFAVTAVVSFARCPSCSIRSIPLRIISSASDTSVLYLARYTVDFLNLLGKRSRLAHALLRMCGLPLHALVDLSPIAFAISCEYS